MIYLVIFLVLCLACAISTDISEQSYQPDCLERIRRLEEKFREREERLSWNTETAYDDEDFYAH